MIRVMLASSLTVLREGMKRILSQQDDIDVIAEVKDVLDLLSDERLAQADVLIMVGLSPAGDTVQCLLHLRQRKPSLQVVFVARSPNLHQVLSIIGTGVRGFLAASSAATHLPAAIRAVSSGRIYLHDEMSSLVATDLNKIGKDRTHRSLTHREFEIFLLLATGTKVSEIASRLGISVKTVSTHKSRMMEKMDMRSVSQLVQYAIVHGVFEAQTQERSSPVGIAAQGRRTS